MENNRGSWGSTFGFIMAAVGSAVGLGNIWGFPYKMGKCGGFSFLLIYLLLAVFVGMIIMCSELALGRKTGKGVIAAYQAVSKKFGCSSCSLSSSSAPCHSPAHPKDSSSCSYPAMALRRASLRRTPAL